MQISIIKGENPNIPEYLGLWVENVYYPQIGAGQIQGFGPKSDFFFIENWQRSVYGGQSFNGLLYQAQLLEWPRFLYLGKLQNNLYYAHGTELKKMPWIPTGEAPIPEALETMNFKERKYYIHKRDQLGHSKPLSDEDTQGVLSHWQQTGELANLIPYLVPYQSLAMTRVSFTQYLAKLKAYLPIQSSTPISQ